jgi:hypothetical protein
VHPPDPPLDGQPVLPGDRIRAVLLDDHTLANGEVALMARATAAQVKAARYQLVCAGLIPPSRITAPPPPRFKDLPRSPPELAEGTCVGHPDADAWTSGDPLKREFAKTVCKFACHVQAICIEWSLSLPERDRAIYGGTTAEDRLRLRASRAGRPVPLRLDPARRAASRARRRAAERGDAQPAAEGGAA